MTSVKWQARVLQRLLGYSAGGLAYGETKWIYISLETVQAKTLGYNENTCMTLALDCQSNLSSCLGSSGTPKQASEGYSWGQAGLIWFLFCIRNCVQEKNVWFSLPEPEHTHYIVDVHQKRILAGDCTYGPHHVCSDLLNLSQTYVALRFELVVLTRQARASTRMQTLQPSF